MFSRVQGQPVIDNVDIQPERSQSSSFQHHVATVRSEPLNIVAKLGVNILMTPSFYAASWLRDVGSHTEKLLNTLRQTPHYQFDGVAVEF